MVIHKNYVYPDLSQTRFWRQNRLARSIPQNRG